MSPLVVIILSSVVNNSDRKNTHAQSLNCSAHFARLPPACPPQESLVNSFGNSTLLPVTALSEDMPPHPSLVPVPLEAGPSSSPSTGRVHRPLLCGPAALMHPLSLPWCSSLWTLSHLLSAVFLTGVAGPGPACSWSY